MERAVSRRTLRWTWRSFEPRQGECIDWQLRAGVIPCCPACGALLEARPNTRLTRVLPLDARGYDLDCRDCRRFWCIVQHTTRSLRLLRMRRLAAAVRAAGAASEGRSAGGQGAAGVAAA